ncbi:MAG TPA: transporter substrate-binding domain-containing protein [Methanocorpusculum sp.]|nr:transporter substrate-binding domain-containing protein [Methanocorpusculum sp.]
MKKSVFIAAAVVLVVLAAVFAAGCTSTPEKTVTGYADLNGSKIAVQLGTTGDLIITDLAAENPGTTLSRYTNIVDGITDLKNGKVDCVVIDSEIAKYYVTDGSGLKIITDPEFSVEEYGFAMKKGNSDLLTKINTALAELKADGTLDKINMYYFGVEGGEQYKKDETIARTGDLKVATHAEFPPYEYKDEGNFVGIDMDLMQAVADKLGLNLVVNDIAFGSILTSIESGKDDVGASAITITDERKKNNDFSDVYATSVQVIVVKE